jgi:hypothetical protein
MTNLIRPAWIAIAGVVASTGVARADDECPPPTLDQCYEDATVPWSYFQTACGAAEAAAMQVDPASACNQIIDGVIASEHVSFTTAVDAKAPVPRALRPPGPLLDPGRDYIADAAIVPFDPYTRPVAVEGLASHFAGARQRYASALVSAQLGGVPTGALADRDAWSANGNAVATCEEYVYERYYDYGYYGDLAASHGADYRASFVDGMALLADGVQSRSGGTTTPVPVPDDLQPKNVFFTYEQLYPRQGIAADAYQIVPYQFADPDLLDRLDRGKEVYLHTLDWHSEMDAVTAQYGDDLLYALAQKQRDFMKLLAQRAAVYQRWVLYHGAQETADLACKLQFEEPELPSDFKRKRPWERIWNPPDPYEMWNPDDGFDPERFDRIPGWDLLGSYDDHAFDGIVVTLPAQLHGMAPVTNAGVYTSPALDYGVAVIDAQATLAARPNDLLATLTMNQLAAATPADLAGVEPAATEINHEGCPGYTGEDGLPSVGAWKFDCASLEPLEACAEGAKRQVTERLQEIDAEIEQALTDIAPYGCLAFPDTGEGFGGVGVASLAPWAIASACDWNPELFVREMERHFETERERDFRACAEGTGSSFAAANHPIHHAMEGGADAIATPARAAAHGVPMVNDYTGSTELVDAFLAMTKEWATAVAFQRDPVTGKPRAGHSASDSDLLGGGMFGVDYGYDAEWKLDGLPDDVWADAAACGVGLHAHAGARADGVVFGMELSLFDAFASVSSTPEGTLDRRGELSLRLEVLGVDILAAAGIEQEQSEVTDVSPEPIEFHVAKEKAKSQEVAAMTMVIAGVPVTVRAGVAGRIGFEVGAKVELTGTCPNLRTTATGNFTPYASLDAYVSGGANVAIAEVGLQIDLTLVKISLPFDLNLALSPFQPSEDPGAGYAAGIPMIHASPKLSLTLSTLAGRFRAYVRLPILKPLYLTLFEWDGVDLGTTTLFNPDWHYSLARVALGLKILGGGH